MMSGKTGTAASRWWPDALAGAMALVIAAPVLSSGYVLSYDAIATPRQWLVPDALGLGDVAPRAVPADAVVAVLTFVLDGAIVQKALLVGLLILAGAGAWRLLPSTSTPARCVAAIAFVWNPWVAERLVIGHWWLLLGYALLPWAVRLAWRVVSAGAGWPDLARLCLAVAAGSLVPTAGVLLAVTVTAVVAVEAVAGRRSRVGAASVVWAWVVQLPWVLPALVTQGSWVQASALPGVEAFAIRAENAAGVAAAALGLGGIWNSEVVPESRLLWTAAAGAAFALIGAVYGWAPAQRAIGRSRMAALGGLALLGFLVAALTATAPGRRLLATLVDLAPGAGLLRDGHKWLAWWSLLLAVLVGFAAERLRVQAARWGAGAAVVALALLAPVVVLPDLAWGVAGRLRPVDYPADYVAVRSLLEVDAPGEVLSLPWSAFRAYEWNAGRTSLDPLPRWLTRPVVVDDALVVGGSDTPGESRRAAEVGAALASGVRAVEALPPLGVRWVVVALDTRGPEVPSGFLAGAEQVYAGDSLVLYDVGEGRAPRLWPAGTAAVVAVDLGLLAVVLGLALALFARTAARLVRSGSTSQAGGSQEPRT